MAFQLARGTDRKLRLARLAIRPYQQREPSLAHSRMNR
jgi:hypothetical protein